MLKYLIAFVGMVEAANFLQMKSINNGDNDVFMGDSEAEANMVHKAQISSEDFVRMHDEAKPDYDAWDGEDVKQIDADDEATDYGADGPEGSWSNDYPGEEESEA